MTFAAALHGTEAPSLHFSSSDSVKSQTPADSHVGEVRHSHTAGAPLNDEGREIAITRAKLLMEFFMVEAAIAQRRYDASSHLVDKADCDAARMHAREALRLMEALIRGRSPEQVLRMAQAQADRMAREPGAEKA
jgi:hypothetical protein